MKMLTTTEEGPGHLEEQLKTTSLDAAQVVRHLKSGALVLSARGTVPDRYDPSAPPIPIAYMTDGLWVWSWETACYAQRYGIGLPVDFLNDVAAASPHAANEVSESAVREALAVVKNRER